MDNETIEILNSFYDYQFENYKMKYKSIIRTQLDINHYFDNYPINKYFNFIVDKAYDILTSLDFKIDKTNGFVEIWRYYLTGKYIEPTLGLHEDDFGGLSSNVETCIFYLRKDKNIIGGNLKYILNEEEKTLEIEDNMIVAFSGNLMHKPEDLDGVGERICIVVQFHSFRK